MYYNGVVKPKIDERDLKVKQYECVIGLEVHVQIKTDSKLFCSCPTTFGEVPNTNICPVCCGYPGVLPVPNKKAVEFLVKTGLALGCTINLESVFARKQYFYPDLPKNYQISQYEKPLAEHGKLQIMGSGDTIGITRIHLEEDAGKLVHTVGSKELDYSLVDLNRTGMPLMEIVSEPDLRSPEQAQEYLATLKMILQYLEVSDCDMEKGSLRCDANISIRPAGETKLNTRVELKNMNSFRGVRDAIVHEIARQIEATENGERIVQETRLWDADKQETRPMRSKEQAHDYRYFPDPDLPPLVLDKNWVENLRQNLPELPAARRQRFMDEYKLSEYDATVLTSDRALGVFYAKAIAPGNGAVNHKSIANWITTELAGRLNAAGKPIEDSPVPAEHIAELVRLIDDGTISGKIAKTVFSDMWETGKKPGQIVKDKGLVQVLDKTQIEQWAKDAVSQNRKAADEYKSGKEAAIGALVGTVMKLSKGQANPQLVNQILKEVLGK